MIFGDNMRRGYDEVEGSIGRSYDEIEGVTVSGNFTMMSEITAGKEVKKWIVGVSPMSSTWTLESPVMMIS